MGVLHIELNILKPKKYELIYRIMKVAVVLDSMME